MFPDDSNIFNVINDVYDQKSIDIFFQWRLQINLTFNIKKCNFISYNFYSFALSFELSFGLHFRCLRMNNIQNTFINLFLFVVVII